jgi:hypothetical protein
VTNQYEGTSGQPAPGDRRRPVGPGGPHGEIQVWCASLDRWVDGFHLVDRTGDGYLVRRLSDGEVLPLAFSDEHVRPRASAPRFPPGR